MPLEGNLRDFSLANLIQLNCQEMNTARLSISVHGREGAVYFDKGNVVHAVFGPWSGEEAVYELLRLKEGDFHMQVGAQTTEWTITTPWNTLLLEGMRRIDEGETSQGDRMGEWVQSLRGIAWVDGAVLISRDGVVMAEALEGNAEKEGAVAVFVGNSADQVGEALSLAPFQWGVVSMGKDRMLVVARPDFVAGLILAERASPAMVASEAEHILSR